MRVGPALVGGRVVYPLHRVQMLVGRRDRSAGSVPDVDLAPLDRDQSVSRRHALLRRSGPSFAVSDLGATNGLLVNGVVLDPGVERLLAAGDVITFGAVTLAYAAQHDWPEGVVAEWEAEPLHGPTPGERTATFGVSLAGQLPAALAASQLVLHYQPKVILATGAVHAVEALVRWQHPRLGLLPPDRFVPAAEETAQVRNLTRLALRLGTAQARRWVDAGIALQVGVNVTVRDLEDPGFVDEVAALLAAAGLAADRLSLEITETGLMTDPERAADTLARLRAVGLGLAIDDFGTGHSSLGYLRRLPVTELKLDRSFVQAFDPHDQAIVASSIDLAHRLGLTVTAEGVESEPVAARLRELGCDAGQGFLFGHPVPGEEISRRLSARPG